ncbi:11594_t:CDS:2, partial [Cetraspora pellucida]
CSWTSLAVVLSILVSNLQSTKKSEDVNITNPHSLYRMNLIQGQLEIMPPSQVNTETDERVFDIIGQLYNWVSANRNLVGKAGGSQGCYTLSNIIDDPKPTILGPDASVVLSARFETSSISTSCTKLCCGITLTESITLGFS